MDDISSVSDHISLKGLSLHIVGFNFHIENFHVLILCNIIVMSAKEIGSSRILDLTFSQPMWSSVEQIIVQILKSMSVAP